VEVEIRTARRIRLAAVPHVQPEVT
jgi:hypothetical protein